MALINCPDCKNQISDSAVACIHCGRPMRLSRDAILIEIKNLEDKVQSNLDYFLEMSERDNPDTDLMQKLTNTISILNDRISELHAMLK